MKAEARPSQMPALYAAVLFAAVLIAFYVRLIVPYIRFPADIFMWGETDFVANIIRLRGGHPMYSPVEDINSSTYPPVAAIVTYLVARVLGLPVGVPVLRFIQLGFVVLSAGVGYVCWRLVRRQLFPDHAAETPRVWAAFAVCVIFLAATSPEIGRHVFMLHTDALALLWSLMSFAALLWYLDRPGAARLAVVCLATAVGFMIKQYLLIWAPVAFFTLLLDDPRDLKRLAVLFVGTTALTAAGVGIGYLLWGPNYIFWVFEVIGGARSHIGFSAGGFELSVPRAGDHFLRAWAPLSLGFVGGWLMLSRVANRRAMALWAPWLVLLFGEAMTSGTGWGALYHFGPGAVVGALWLLAMLPEVWLEGGEGPPHRWMRSAWAFLAALAIFFALDTVPSGDRTKQRYWQRSLPEGADEYVAAIEAEFEGVDPAEVLVDWGNWTYLDANVLQRDRPISMWDFPTVGRYDLLEPLLRRIESKAYSKILVRNYTEPGFDYDWSYLERPTGVRAALMDNYRVVRRIPGLEGRQLPPEIQYGGEVTVLVPKEVDE